jgi:SAM-dependent methyltransferase
MADRDYVLGTDAEEIERLGLQHRVWRPQMLDGFARAGFAPGMTVIDLGCGPGYASVDLAELVGPEGRVLGFERSRRFLESLEARAAERGLANIRVKERDVSAEELGAAVADGAWCRWVLSFVADPARTVAHVARALKPGGVALFHEYADYGAWRTLPPSADIDRFRDLVTRSWRNSGGEPDAALQLPTWLAAAGMEVVEARPMIDIVGRDDFAWQWPRAFIGVNAHRLHALGYIEAAEADRLAGAIDALPEGTLMMTPVVAEVIARKRG